MGPAETSLQTNPWKSKFPFDMSTSNSHWQDFTFRAVAFANQLSDKLYKAPKITDHVQEVTIFTLEACRSSALVCCCLLSWPAAAQADVLHCRYLARLEMRLHLAAEDVEASIDSEGKRALSRIPIAISEVSHVQVCSCPSTSSELQKGPSWLSLTELLLWTRTLPSLQLSDGHHRLDAMINWDETDAQQLVWLRACRSPHICPAPSRWCMK